MGSQQLTELSSQLVTARANAATMLARLQRIEAIMRDGVGGGSVTDGLDNKVIVGLRQQYVDDDRRMAELSAKFGKDHVVVRDLRNEMIEVKKSIQGELARIAETYKSDYEVARANEASVQARLDQMVATAAQTNNDLVLLRSLQSSADTYRSLYQNFLQRYTQAVQDQSFPVPEARVITAALPPQRKSEPKTTMILAFAIALGSGLGFAVAFVRETLDRSIRSPAQLRAATGTGLSGTWCRAPRLRDTRPYAAADREQTSAHGRAHLDVVSRQHPASRRRRATVGVRRCHPRCADADRLSAHALARHQGHWLHRPVRTGPAHRRSRPTSRSCWLRRTARTILLDWDFLHASLSRKLTGRTEPGCLDVLGRTSRTFGLSSARTNRRTSAFFQPVYSDTASLPVALGQSEQMHNLLAELRSRYSYVVVDLPSLSDGGGCALCGSHAGRHRDRRGVGAPGTDAAEGATGAHWP